MSDRGSVAITGANGYVGMTLCAAFGASGYRVIALQRSAPADARDYVPYSLEDGPATLPGDVAAVVHCAYDLRARDRAEIERINLGGTEKLLQGIGDVPLVLISSQSAYAGTQQIYGGVKLPCEDLVTARGGTSLRLGIVHGGADGGMIGALRKVAALPIVPMPAVPGVLPVCRARRRHGALCGGRHRTASAAPRPRRRQSAPGSVQRGHVDAARRRQRRAAPCRTGAVRLGVPSIADGGGRGR